MTRDAHLPPGPPVPEAEDPSASTADTVIGTAPVTVPVPPPGYPPVPVPNPTGRTTGPETADRPWVNLVWEGILLVVIGLGIAGCLLFGPLDSLSDVDRFALVFVPVLVLATAVGLSLRVGAVNFAVVAVATAAGPVHRLFVEENPLLGVAVVVGGAVVVGAVLALLVTVCRAPGWAASLAVGVGLFLAMNHFRDRLAGGTITGPSEEIVQWLILAVAVVVSLGGGLLGMIPGVRRVLGDCRDAEDGYRRRGPAGAAVTWLALIGSSVLAAAAGVIGVTVSGPFLGITGDPQLMLALVLGIVLVGGTGLRGRRGGVAGTVLAWVLVMGAWWLTYVLRLDSTILASLPVAVLLLGLIVNGVLNRVSRPRTKSHRTASMPPVGLPPNMVSADELVPGFAPAEQSVPESVGPPAPRAGEPMAGGPFDGAVAPPDAADPIPAAPLPPVTPPEGPRPGSVMFSETPDATSSDPNTYRYRPPAG